jgi:hypothetical protein
MQTLHMPRTTAGVTEQDITVWWHVLAHHTTAFCIAGQIRHLELIAAAALSLSRFSSPHLEHLSLSLTAAFSKAMRLLESFVSSNFSRSLSTACIYLLPLVHFSLNLKATDISEQNCATQATDHAKLRVL